MFAAVHAPNSPAALVECAQAFSPVVELAAAHTAVLDAAGLERIFGHPRELAGAIARRAARLGFEASVAIARNPDAAICAARGFKGISIVPHGDEAKFLAPLPLAVLEPPPEMTETLARWGLRRFHDLAALPEHGLAARLGREGVRLRKLARGEWERPLAPVEDPLVFEEDLELEYPVDLLEPLAFLLARLLNGITVRLAARGLATNELRLCLALEDKTVHERALRLPVPMLDARAFLKLMQLDLAANPPAAPVVRIAMTAEPVKPRAGQTGLFIPLAPEPEKLEVTLARLGALVGTGNVGSPELLDTHRPDAFRMRRFGALPAAAGTSAVAATALAWRVFRPPRAAEVRMAAGHPAHISAPGIRGSVASFAGPWRTSGDWWTPEPWDRDEWDIALHDGALYRLFCDRKTGRWFLEGAYD